jgi:electron transfer flavoprotein alpha subunit
MAILVIAEHDGKLLRPGVTNTIAAAAKMGGDITVLVAGKQCAEAAQAAAKIDGVSKVLLCEAPHFEGALAENIAALVLSVAGQYTHIVAPASGFGKNFMPRVAWCRRRFPIVFSHLELFRPRSRSAASSRLHLRGREKQPADRASC